MTQIKQRKTEEVFQEEEASLPLETNQPSPPPSYTFSDIKWTNVILLLGLHLAALYAKYLYIIGEIKWQNALFAWIFGAMSALGITIGAHRLWSHRSFKAKLPLRILLAFWDTCALETNIYEWCRDHRVHHKYSETSADPHDSRRGVFFAHVGWLLLKKRPEVIEAGRKLDLSDLLADPVVAFQRRYYLPLAVLCWGLLPTAFSVYVFDERPLNAFLYCVIYRYVYVIHVSWTVNSLAHRYGNRPYSVEIEPRENRIVTWMALGEGYHNYHHVFPYDYSASEFGVLQRFNVSTALIDLWAAIGLAYDLKKPNREMVAARMERSGDGLEKRMGSGKEEERPRGSSKWSTMIADWILGGFVSTFAIVGLGFGLRILVTGGLFNRG